MTAADQIRALADTGTPGPLREASWGERGLRTLRSTRDDVWLADVRDHGDAAKIVVAVNALPHIADLIDVIDNAPGPYIACADPDCKQATCTITRARDALVEALGVTP